MSNSVLVIFGAGAERALGFPTTQDIENIFKALIGFENNRINKYIPLNIRLENALRDYFGYYSRQNDKTYHIYKNLELTLRIMLDGNGAKNLKEAENDKDKAINEFIQLYKRFIESEYTVRNHERLYNNIAKMEHYLYLQSFSYDWVNIKALSYYLYKDQPNKFQLVDLLSILYNSKQSGLPLVAPEYFDYYTHDTSETGKVNWYICNVDGIFNMYNLILYKIYKGVYYTNLNTNNETLKHYFDFIQKMLDKYNQNITFVSFNWNPIIQALAYLVNYKFNTSVGKAKNRYRYIDHSSLIDIVRLKDSEDENRIIPSFTENIEYFSKKLCKEPKTIESIKFYPIHGTFNTRVCPKCSSVFMIYPKTQGDIDITQDLYDLLLVDPFPSMKDFEHYKKYSILKKKLENPEDFDTIYCHKCNTPISFKNTILEIQIMFKDYSHYSLKSMLYGFANEFSKAQKIIILGYSFPNDDVKDLLFLKAFKDIKQIDSNKQQEIYIVNYDEKYKHHKRWMSIDEVKNQLPNLENYQINELIHNLEKLFKKENIKLSFQGVPWVFLNGNRNVDISIFEK
ncbi:hypothetical protein [Hydrogenobaculum acidophilum]